MKMCMSGSSQKRQRCGAEVQAWAGVMHPKSASVMKSSVVIDRAGRPGCSHMADPCSAQVLAPGQCSAAGCC